ncbi:hypothetical protein JQ628_16435 [Bradyrhizobium lablabi]|uniref:hypothetical protein n=1 Tax=Bradyrhizobium lablabi TaxID=722472 RepID=UPI001BAB83D7|nr:hypothetical protein [Bradyrhizobium lablabi]MBR1123116.1 hypothetical protein [Bradyrhizobium lablabi]
MRFLVRLAILLLFAAFSGAGFVKGMVALLWMAAILCAATAVFRGEPPLDGDLNNWDEAAAYLAVCCLANSFMLHAPA